MKLCVNILQGLGFDYLIGDPDGVPIVVQMSTRGWLPVSVLIFAENEGVARAKVLNAIQGQADRKVTPYNIEVTRAQRILKLLETGEMEIKTELFDRRYLATIPWAGNKQLP